MLNITQKELQAMLPVLTFPTEELSNKILDQVPMIYVRVREAILGTVGEEAIDREEIRLVASRNVASNCLLSVFHQMDVVATPTGFGVVSNQDTAPASSARVQALKNEVLDIELHSRHALISKLACIPGWGDTEQAKSCINSTFYNSLYLQTYCGMSRYGHEEWQKALPAILLADNIMRRKMGNQLFADILNRLRHADIRDYIPLTQLMHAFTASHIVGDVMTQVEAMRQLLMELEDPLKQERYQAYYYSSAYRANHYKRKRNDKDSPGFIFGR